MIIFKKTADIQHYLSENALEAAFVPTMGALHEGHISLVKKAKEGNKTVVVSIFVNPTQFNDKTDFEKYPQSVELDIALLAEAGCDILLLPAVSEIYPEGTGQMTSYDFGYLDTILEGAQRPGHFKGVGQVVARLLDIVKPKVLYLGQKDYQQCKVIARLMEKEAVHKAELVILPTQREPDGLAMSSRNRRLTEPQRAVAGLIYQCLVSIQAKQNEGNFVVVKKECADILEAKGFDPEYIVLADAGTLEEIQDYEPSRKMVSLIAARIGDIRLIDNMLL